MTWYRWCRLARRSAAEAAVEDLFCRFMPALLAGFVDGIVWRVVCGLCAVEQRWAAWGALACRNNFVEQFVCDIGECFGQRRIKRLIVEGVAGLDGRLNNDCLLIGNPDVEK